MRPRLALGALAVALVAAAVLSLAVGRVTLSPATILQVLTAHLGGERRTLPAAAETVVMLIRLPRILAAILVGTALAQAGTVYQTVFRNPLASPSLLGVSAGAGFGASLALIMHGTHLAVQAAAFGGGLLAVGLALGFGRMLGGRSLVTLVLCGLVIAALFQALTSVVKYFAEPLEVLPAITFWLMGSMAKVTGGDVATAAGPIVACAALIYVLRWRINVLALGDGEALALGVDVRLIRSLAVLAATLMVATTVSIGGTIGWVGLIVPHAARMMFGLDPDRCYPATALLGALFLLAVDDVARGIGAVEMPLGVLTALVGAPVFLLLLSRSRRGVWA